MCSKVDGDTLEIGHQACIRPARGVVGGAPEHTLRLPHNASLCMVKEGLLDVGMQGSAHSKTAANFRQPTSVGIKVISEQFQRFPAQLWEPGLLLRRHGEKSFVDLPDAQDEAIIDAGVLRVEKT